MRKVLSLLPLIFLLSCTRQVGSNSTVTVNTPMQFKNFGSGTGATAPSQPFHVGISISWDGAAPIVWSWDSHCNQSATCTDAPPSSFSFTVPRGTNRLFQYIAVYQNSDQSRSFYYGDYQTDLNSDTANIPIVASLAQQAPQLEGRVAGRYSDASGHGPTGIVYATYTPPGGKPPMPVIQSQIIDGFFEFTVLSGVPLDYILAAPNGAPLTLFPQLSLESSLLNPTSQTPQVMRIRYPEYYRMNNTTLEYEGPRAWILGFFGPGARSTQKICYNNTASGPVSNYYVDMALQTHLGYNLTNAPNTQNVYVQGGGSPSSNIQSCESGQQYFDWMYLNHTLIAQGNDDFSGFVGPFTAQSFWNPSLTPNWTLTLLQPLADDHMVDGVDIFALNPPGTSTAGGGNIGSPAMTSDGEFKCNLAAMLNLPVLTSQIFSGTSDLAIPFPSGLIGQPFGVCPYKTVQGARIYYEGMIRN